MRVSVVLCTHTLDRYPDFSEAARVFSIRRTTTSNWSLVSDGNEAVFDRFRQDFGDRDDVVCHRNDENVGLLESRNNGAEVATGDVVAFVDDDAIADERWVEELVDVYEQRDVRAVGGRMTPAWVAGSPPSCPKSSTGSSA